MTAVPSCIALGDDPLAMHRGQPPMRKSAQPHASQHRRGPRALAAGRGANQMPKPTRDPDGDDHEKSGEKLISPRFS